MPIIESSPLTYGEKLSKATALVRTFKGLPDFDATALKLVAYGTGSVTFNQGEVRELMRLAREYVAALEAWRDRAEAQLFLMPGAGSASLPGEVRDFFLEPLKKLFSILLPHVREELPGASDLARPVWLALHDDMHAALEQPLRLLALDFTRYQVARSPTATAPPPPRATAPKRPDHQHSHAVRDARCTYCGRTGAGLNQPCGNPDLGRFGLIELD